MVASITLGWIVLVLLTPILSPAQIVVSNWLLRGKARGFGEDYEKRRILFGAAIKIGVLGLFVFTFPVSLPFEFSPIYGSFLLLGFALYHVESFVRVGWGDESRGGSLDVPVVRALGVGTAAFVEEILYRGGLSPLIESFGATAFVLLSAVSFGAMHGLFDDWTEIGYKTLLGVILASLFVVTGSLVVPIFVHLGYNGAYVQHGTGWKPLLRSGRSDRR